MKEELIDLISSDEKIIFEGKPNKKYILLKSILSYYFIILLFWVPGIFYLFWYYFLAISDLLSRIGLIFFFNALLIPLFFYVKDIINSLKNYKNSYYIVTDKAVYASFGIIKEYEQKSYSEISYIDLYNDIYNWVTHTGNIELSLSCHEIGIYSVIMLEGVDNCDELYNIMKHYHNEE